MNKVLVTGSSGFIGSKLAKMLGDRVAHGSRDNLGGLREYSKIDANLLVGCSAVIHLAARVHVRGSEEDFRLDNVNATLSLAKKALECGVKRFIFMSTVGVYGSTSVRPFEVHASCHPDNTYASSKLEAEKQLMGLARDEGLELIIVRPPMVYGEGAKGSYNFLLKLMKTGLPLPLGNINNKRSFISVDRLCETLIKCLDREVREPTIIQPHDEPNISTTQFIQREGEKHGLKVRLFWIPAFLLRLPLTLLGKESLYHSLFSSFELGAQE